MTSQANEHPALLERIMLLQALPEDAAKRFLAAEGTLATGALATGALATGALATDASPEATARSERTLSDRLSTLYGPVQESQHG